MKNRKKLLTIQNITLIAVLGAFATAAYYLLEVPIIPFAPHLKVNFADIPSVIGGLVISPLAGLLVLVIRCAAHLFRTTTAGIGELMDIFVGTSLLMPFMLVYRKAAARFGLTVSYSLAAAAGAAGAVIGGIIGNSIFYPIFVYFVIGKEIETFNIFLVYLGGTVVANLVRSGAAFIGCLPFLPLIPRFKEIISRHK
ncbi:MAG: ECF transporter S component [Oscillospiraceae bacterium]|jgi:riboflavin transporter FmnP|nr:ECF transporter S component [Oscillospiraceae bacterium]